MGNKQAFMGLGCGVIAILVGAGLFISNHNHLLLKSVFLYFGIAYTIAFTVIVIDGICDETPKFTGIIGFIFVFGGALIISSIPIQVWPGTSSGGLQLFAVNGLSWAFASIFIYSVISYGYPRIFPKYIPPIGLLIISMLPLVAGVIRVLEAGSPVVVTRHLVPLLLIYGLSIIAIIPIYVSGRSIERNRQISAKSRRSKPVGIAVVCSIYVLSFIIGVSYYHPLLQNWTSISFVGVTIIPALLVGYFTWKKSLDFSSNPST